MLMKSARNFWDKISKEKKYKILVAAILIFASVWALILASRQQVWFDESYSIWITKGKSFSETVSLTSVDAHPPFYYLILNLWGNLVGWNFFGLRILSVIFFILSIFVAIKFTQSIFGRKVAVISGALVAFSPFLLRYAFEIRMYSLASLITVASTYVLFLAQKTPESKKIWIIYVILVTTGMWTLYTLAIVFLSHFLILISKNLSQKNYKIWQENWFRSYVLAVVLWLPWLQSFIFQLKNSASSGIGDYIGFSQIENMFNFLFFYQPVGAVAPIFALVGLPLIIWLVLRNKKYFSESKILFHSAFVPFLITIVLSQPIWLKKPFFVERYMSQFVILAYLVLAICIAKILLLSNKRRSLVVVVSILAIVIVGNFNLWRVGNFNFQNYRLSNARENMDKIASICGQNTVLMDDIYLFIELELYNDSRCDFRIFTPDARNYGGGYAPINNFERRIIGADIFKTPDILVVMNKDKKPDFLGGFIEQKQENLPYFENLSIYKFSKK